MNNFYFLISSIFNLMYLVNIDMYIRHQSFLYKSNRHFSNHLNTLKKNYTHIQKMMLRHQLT